jgi:hypothetical protein
MSSYFRAQIDRHVHGMRASAVGQRPAGVRLVTGTVTDRTITVTMQDGTVWSWTGGQYAARKVHGCYAPLMPRVQSRPQPPQEGTS